MEKQSIYSKIGYYKREVRRANEKIAKLVSQRDQHIACLKHLYSIIDADKKRGGQSE